jgi:hypothetical protein
MSIAMLPSYVLLDLETTGATPLKDGIEVSRWQGACFAH